MTGSWNRASAVIALAAGLLACRGARAGVADVSGREAAPVTNASSGPVPGADASADASFFEVQRERVASESRVLSSGWIGSLGVGFSGRTFAQESIPVLFSFGGTLEKRFLGRLGIDLGGSLDAGTAVSPGGQSLTGFEVSAGLPIFLMNVPRYELTIGPRAEWARDSWSSSTGSLPITQRRAGAAVGLRISSFLARFEYDPFGTISGGSLTAVPSASVSLMFWDPLGF